MKLLCVELLAVVHLILNHSLQYIADVNPLSNKNNKMGSIILKKLMPGHCASALAYIQALHRAAGWNDGKHDFSAFVDSKQISLYLIVLRDSNKDQNIGSISVFNSQSYFAIGAFCIAEAFRGQGYGKTVFQQVLSEHEGQLGWLLSVPKARSLYERNGFVQSHTIISFSYPVKPTHTQALSNSTPTKETIALMTRIDKNFVKIDRSTLLEALAKTSDNIAYVLSTAAPDDQTERHLGYGILRPLEKPNQYQAAIYAASYDDFKKIFDELIYQLACTITQETIVNLDCPEENESYISALGSTELNRYALMFKTAPLVQTPPIIGKHTWSLLTKESC